MISSVWHAILSLSPLIYRHTYTHIYIYVYIHTYTYVYVCIHSFLCFRSPSCSLPSGTPSSLSRARSLYIYICPRTHTYIHTCISSSIYVHRVNPIHTHTYVYICIHSFFTLQVTFMLSSVWHAILDNFRPITIWAVELYMFYANVGGGGHGELYIERGIIQLSLSTCIYIFIYLYLFICIYRFIAIHIAILHMYTIWAVELYMFYANVGGGGHGEIYLYTHTYIYIYMYVYVYVYIYRVNPTLSGPSSSTCYTPMSAVVATVSYI